MRPRVVSPWPLLALFASISVSSLAAQAPQWWTDREVIDVSASSSDFAAVNQGQVKNLAAEAAAELLENLPLGIDAGIWQMVNGWLNPASSANDFAPVNLGQLKNVAQPFYDRLIDAGYWAGDYPWIGAGTPNDFALANIGQAKNLFAFDITFDTGSGIPDWWEIKWLGQPGAPGAGGGPSPGDPNVSLEEAYQEGRSPLGSTDDGPLAAEEVGLEVFLPL